MPSKKKVSSTKKIVDAKNKKVVAKVLKKTNKNDFIKGVQKRDGEIVPFDIEKITNAVNKAMLAGGEGGIEEAAVVAHKVLAEIELISKENKNFIPTVEGIQDSVEKQLMLAD